MECNPLLQVPDLTSQLWTRVPRTESPNAHTPLYFGGFCWDSLSQWQRSRWDSLQDCFQRRQEGTTCYERRRHHSIGVFITTTRKANQHNGVSLCNSDWLHTYHPPASPSPRLQLLTWVIMPLLIFNIEKLDCIQISISREKTSFMEPYGI